MSEAINENGSDKGTTPAGGVDLAREEAQKASKQEEQSSSPAGGTDEAKESAQSGVQDGISTQAPKEPETATEEAEEPIEEYDGPMATYKITGEAGYTDENGNNPGNLEIGKEYELPEPVGNSLVEKGVAERV